MWHNRWIRFDKTNENNKLNESRKINVNINSSIGDVIDNETYTYPYNNKYQLKLNENP